MISFDQKRLDEIISGYYGKRIMILGDLMIDEYLIGSVSRISPEAPVPVIEVNDQTHRLGGAANVALNTTALGCETVMVGIIGDDMYGDLMLERLKDRHVSGEGVFRLKNRPTTVKTRIIGDSQHIARVDREDNRYLDESDSKRLLTAFEILIGSVHAIILQDYNKGVLTEGIITQVITRAKEKKILISVDPKFKNFLKYRNVSLFKPNIKETEQALAMKISNEKDLDKAGKKLLNSLQADSVLITRGSAGMSLFEKNGSITHVPTRARKVADVSGAGDTVISTLTAALVGGASFQEAATIANYAAGIVCEEIGIVPVEAEKLYRLCLGQSS